MRGNRRKKNRGSALIAVTMVISVVLVLGAVYAMTTLRTHRLQRSYQEGDRARAAAMAGMEYALYRLAHETEGDEGVSFETSITVGGVPVLVRAAEAGAVDITGGLDTNLVTVETQAETGGVARSLRVVVHNDSYAVHELYHKAIFAGNRHGGPYVMEFTGKGSSGDDVRGDVHNNGDIEYSLNGIRSWNNGSNVNTATGEVRRVDETGRTRRVLGGRDEQLLPPDLRSMGYDSLSRRYREWDASFQGGNRNVVHVGEAFEHYRRRVQDIRISREGGWFRGGYYEWNSQAQALPDDALADFFHMGYQNHFCDDYSAADDARMKATKNYYLGQRNGGTRRRYGNTYGLYGGGHSVITITEEQNDKVYYVDGNLWVDSDGSNHVFFVPGPGVERVNITIVVRGNIYIGDQIWTVGKKKSANIGGSTHARAFRDLDRRTGLALIAMADGESYNDVNRNGKYDVGETIIGRSDPSEPASAERNPSRPGSYVTNYQGRMEGSGNIVFGDTISGPVGAVEAFLYAENNFQDITADTSQGDQNAFTYGNMTAGNRVYLKRNYRSWQHLKRMRRRPAGWVRIGRYHYPPGTTRANVDNPFLTDRLWYNGRLYARRHNPLRVTLDRRVEEGEVDLPGLPHARRSHQGTWRPLAVRFLEGRVFSAEETEHLTAQAAGTDASTRDSRSNNGKRTRTRTRAGR